MHFLVCATSSKCLQIETWFQPGFPVIPLIIIINSENNKSVMLSEEDGIRKEQGEGRVKRHKGKLRKESRM